MVEGGMFTIDTFGDFFLAEKVEVALGVHFCTCNRAGMHDSITQLISLPWHPLTYFVNCHDSCFSVAKNLFNASMELGVGHPWMLNLT